MYRKSIKYYHKEYRKACQRSDYDDFYVVSIEDVTNQLQNAKRFVETVEQYLLTQYF